jgi:hypothetical protein
MPQPKPKPDDLAAVRERAHAAWYAARQGDLRDALIADRVWAETLIQMQGQPAHVRTVMLQRIAIFCEILTDRRGWPQRVATGTKKRRASRTG